MAIGKNDKVFCGLDVGSQGIRAAIIKRGSDREPEILGIFQQPTQGYANGSITDLADFTDAVSQAVNQLSSKLGIKVKDVYLSIPGAMAASRSANTMIPLIERGSKVVNNRDVNKVKEQARLLGVETDEEVIHDVPQSYQVDEANSISNPVGLYGRKLGIHSLMIVTESNRMRNLVKAVNQAGYDVSGMFLGSFAAHHVALTEEERIGGCVIVDMGCDSTDILVFNHGILCFYERLPVGGINFTRAVAESLNLSYDLAEEIKRTYGDINPENFRPDEELLVKKDSAYTPVRREKIYQALIPAAQLVVNKMKDGLKNNGVLYQVNHGIVLIGGGSLLPGFVEKISQEILPKVRLAKITLSPSKSVSNASLYLAAIGAARAGMEESTKTSAKSESNGNWASGFGYRIRDLYQEYF